MASASRAGGAPALPRRVFRILVRTVQAFVADNVPRLGAALAFYITISVAPLLVLTIAVAGMLFDDQHTRQTVVAEIEGLIGSKGAEVVTAIEPPEEKPSGLIATAVSVATLLFGALKVFKHLRAALNAIWRVREPDEKGFLRIVGHQLFSMATVLMTGFLLLVSLILTAALSWFGGETLGRLELPGYALAAINMGISFTLVMVLFALIFKLLPNTHVRWRHVWLGAGVTALLFTVGKAALGIYLGKASVTSAYGAAGSIIALLLWCYYACQIVFLGAEFTRITDRSNGGRDFAPLDEEGERELRL